MSKLAELHREYNGYGRRSRQLPFYYCVLIDNPSRLGFAPQILFGDIIALALMYNVKGHLRDTSRSLDELDTSSSC